MPICRQEIQQKAHLRGQFIALLLLSLIFSRAVADISSARQAMENQTNPLLLMNTTEGNIYMELFPDEAPRNVANLLALVEGQVEITDFENSRVFTPRYYDGMRFHRVVPGLLIQTGSPYRNVFGSPGEAIPDEINAITLGLDSKLVVMPDGSFNPILQISDRNVLEEKILLPLYKAMGIDSNQSIRQQQFVIDERLREMTLKQAFENLGYSYTDRFPTRPIDRGVVAMANSGPNSNSTEFFVSVSDSNWLTGLYTVIGHVVEGLEVVDTINNSALETAGQANTGTLIYSIRLQ